MSEDAKPVAAFPQSEHSRARFTGMTLRDYFAAKAMQSLLGAALFHRQLTPYSDIATSAYGCAHAMLAERSKTK